MRVAFCVFFPPFLNSISGVATFKCPDCAVGLFPWVCHPYGLGMRCLNYLSANADEFQESVFFQSISLYRGEVMNCWFVLQMLMVA